MTLFVNLFGSPGAGKSTTRAGVFRQLKLKGINVEEVPEVAKDFTWEERKKTLKSQPYIFGKQLRNMERLIDKVDVIVTDSPVLLSSFYADLHAAAYPHSFHQFVVDMFDQLVPREDFLIRRVKPYNPAGRGQTEEESDKIGILLPSWLTSRGVDFRLVCGAPEADGIIANAVIASLHGSIGNH